MTDRDLKFPSPGDDAGDELPRDLVGRIEAMYRNTPAADESQVERCVNAVRDGIARGLPVPSRSRTRVWLGVAAAAAVLVAITARTGLVSRGGGLDTLTVGTTTEGNKGVVQFLLSVPSGASQVSLVGDWNGWDTSATPMARGDGKNAWSAKVTLPPGRHVYAYVINGDRWVVDPMAPQADAGYGPANALVVDGTF